MFAPIRPGRGSVIFEHILSVPVQASPLTSSFRPAGGGPRGPMTVCRCREAGRSQLGAPRPSEEILAAQAAVLNQMETMCSVCLFGGK